MADNEITRRHRLPKLSTLLRLASVSTAFTLIMMNISLLFETFVLLKVVENEGYRVIYRIIVAGIVCFFAYLALVGLFKNRARLRVHLAWAFACMAVVGVFGTDFGTLNSARNVLTIFLAFFLLAIPILYLRGPLPTESSIL